MSFRATTPGNVVEELLLQHPLDFFSFSFLDFDWIEELSLLIVIVFLPFLCVSNSGTSAVGPAEYRLTLSSRPSSTSCFPSALNTSLTSIGEYIAPAIVSFRPIKRTRRFSPARSLASNAARCPSRFSTCSSQSSVEAIRQRHIGPCTRCTLPSFSNSRISGMHQLDACTGCSCKKCLPMVNCLLYALMHACVYCLSLSCNFSIWYFERFSKVK